MNSIGYVYQGRWYINTADCVDLVGEKGPVNWVDLSKFKRCNLRERLVAEANVERICARKAKIGEGHINALAFV